MARNLVEFVKMDRAKNGWNIQPVSLTSDGECPTTGDRLGPATFAPDELTRLAEKFRLNFNSANSIDTIRRHNETDLQRIENLVDKIKFDFVIDGLNVAFLDTRGYKRENLRKVMQLLEVEATRKNKKYNVLIVLRFV